MNDQEQRLADGAACLKAAQEYLARGWSVIPLCPWDHVGAGRGHSKDCGSPGKAPLVGWKAYQDRLPSAGEVASWWKRWPNANVGVVMGPVSRLVGIDVDGQAGWEALREMALAELPTTLEFDTPGGGFRLLYEIPAGLVFPPGFESFVKHQELRLLGKGSQTVAPPSRHRSGGYYAWRKW
jgi:hypothetical protein